MNRRPMVDRWYSPLAEKNAFASPSNSDMCVCIPLPGCPERGFGMNVA